MKMRINQNQNKSKPEKIKRRINQNENKWTHSSESASLPSFPPSWVQFGFRKYRLSMGRIQRLFSFKQRTQDCSVYVHCIYFHPIYLKGFLDSKVAEFVWAFRNVRVEMFGQDVGMFGEPVNSPVEVVPLLCAFPQEVLHPLLLRGKAPKESS